jgi:acyl-homoserine lactone acylase PvdQ
MAPDEENFRGIHAVRVLSQAKDVTLDGLIELAYDPYIPAFEKVIPALVDALERNSAKQQQHMEAYNILKNWDFATGKESVAMTLAQFYGNAYYRSGEVPREGNGMERFEHLATGVSDSKKIEIFETALAEIEKDFGTWKLPWGEYNRFQRLSGEIDLEYDDDQPSIAVGLASGRWGALASFGARSYDTRKIYGSSGNSFVAVVEFGDKVKAKSILAGGQSNDPNSPHFYDQAQRYADIKFKDVAFYKEDVLKRAEETYRPGKR